MRALHLLLLLLSVAVSSAISASPPGVVRPEKKGTLVGGWTPIENISDPHVLQVAEFAVDEHNKQPEATHQLKLEKVVRGETQVVAGLKYRLVVEATDVGAVERAEAQCYEAVVWEKSWENFMQLLSFKVINS